MNEKQLTSRSSRNSRYVSAIAIQKLVLTPISFSSALSISRRPVSERTVSTGVRSWNTSSGVWTCAGGWGCKIATVDGFGWVAMDTFDA